MSLMDQQKLIRINAALSSIVTDYHNVATIHEGAEDLRKELLDRLDATVKWVREELGLKP